MESTTPAAFASATAGMSPEQIERYWFENVYQGDKLKQLTLRAVIMGMLLGMVLALSNVYVGLKAGWSMGVAITSCIMAFTIFATLRRLLPRWFPTYTILENNAMQSAASAAGSMTSAGLVNAIPALMMLNPSAIPSNHWWLALWMIVLSMLGVFLAIPAKRQMVNVEQLPFPDGIAAAATMRTLHAEGDQARNQAVALFGSGLLGMAITWLRDIGAAFPYPRFDAALQRYKLAWLGKVEEIIPTTWGTAWAKVGAGAYSLKSLTLAFEGSLLFVAAGAIMSFRQAWSLLLGAVVNYGILAPMMLDRGVIPLNAQGLPSFRNISSWSLWIGVPMMVTSGLLLFFLQWRTVVRAFSTITAFFRRDSRQAEDPMERIEVPGTWFLGGFLVFGAIAIVLGGYLFQIAWWMGLIAVLATSFLVIVAARATGETNITPVGPLSKITQLAFGVIHPGNMTTNLMTANISAGATAHAGDLLLDLKSGYLLGANPRQQFLAQFFGVIAGGLVVVPAFFAIVGDGSVLGSEKWPAPAALVWKGVAELLAKGVGALHPTARWGLLIGALVGLALPLLELAFPKAKPYIPSATGLGLAFTINGFNSVSMFIGALLALGFRRLNAKLAESYTIPISSGIIAGESLIGIAVALLVA